MIVGTKGIVLRVVRYGETSIICTFFTELLGLQAYLVKGVRSDKKQSQRGNLFRPGNVLDMQVYHQSGKNIQYIKEFSLAHFYETIGDNVLKNTVLLFTVEVLSNLVQTEDSQEELFEFTLAFFKQLDKTPNFEIANFPIFFLQYSAKLMGYAIDNNYTEKNCFLNTYEGCFELEMGSVAPSFDAEISEKFHGIIQAQTIEEIGAVALTSNQRTIILEGFLHFLQWHVKSFRPLKCLPVLRAILN